MEERPVDRHHIAAQQLQLMQRPHKTTVRRLQRRSVVLAELADRPVARHQTLQQPHHLHVAPRLALQPPRRTHLVQVAIQIKPQQIGRVIRRLPRTSLAIGMAETQRRNIQRANIRRDRTNRVVRSNVIIHPRRQQAALLAALSSLEPANRHATNRTASQKPAVLILAQPLPLYPSYATPRRRTGASSSDG
jgi:hypothetical protein